jgi:hypothetical protein
MRSKLLLNDIYTSVKEARESGDIQNFMEWEDLCLMFRELSLVKETS